MTEGWIPPPRLRGSGSAEARDLGGAEMTEWWIPASAGMTEGAGMKGVAFRG